MRSVVILGVCVSLAWTGAVAGAQELVTRLSMEEAVGLAMRENPTVGAKEFERQGVAANEITAGLRPNPQATFLSEQHPGGSASIPQYTFSVCQPIELGGKRQRRIDSAKAATRVTGFELADLHLPKARQARETVDFAYRRGGVSLLDFLDAQRTYRETALEYLRALGNYQAALYQLEAAVGGPLEN